MLRETQKVKFFFPNEDDPAKAEQLYEVIRKIARDGGFEVSERRIRSISFHHHAPRHRHTFHRTVVTTVGDIDPIVGETVIAILEADVAYLVCTSNRGYLRGLPAPVGKGEVFDSEDFEK